MGNNAEQDRLIKGIVKLSKVSKEQKKSQLEVVQNTINTQAEIIEFKRLLVEEDKKVLRQLIDLVAKEDSEGRVINAISERSEYNILMFKCSNRWTF